MLESIFNNQDRFAMNSQTEGGVEGVNSFYK